MDQIFFFLILFYFNSFFFFTGVRLVNISLTHCGASRESDTSLGAIAIAKHLWRGLHLPDLRQLMRQQLPQVVPNRFVFLSSER